MLLAVSVQSTLPQPSGDPGSPSMPSVELSMMDIASPSLLLRTPPSWQVLCLEDPSTGLLLRLAPPPLSTPTCPSEADFFMLETQGGGSRVRGSGEGSGNPKGEASIVLTRIPFG